MNGEDSRKLIETAALESSLLRRQTAESLSGVLIELAETISAVIGSGGKLLICGNGGSAGDSSHMATELIVRLTAERNRQALPAIALSADTSILTACGNDYGFDQIFARQVQGLGKAGDVLILISTSGNSTNLIKAAESAREMKLLTVGLLGGDGGKLLPLCDKKLIVPHSLTQRIQEEHIFLIHLLVELIESDLCG
ncbi:MAG: SIS domain-containing protein [candidate division Zixibacteria bacterium]|nr:SIS domain-containing protein [candidate division Zixibacteria bacterium]